MGGRRISPEVARIAAIGTAGANASAFVLRRGVLVDLCHTHGGLVYSCRTFSAATDVNANDEVVGYVLEAGTDKHAFYWNPVTGMHIFPIFGGIDDVATGINRKRVIVGYSQSLTGIHATVWNTAGTPIDIHPAGYVDSRALGVTDDGMIFGTADGNVVQWLPGGGFVDSRTPFGTPASYFGGAPRYPVGGNLTGKIAFGSPVSSSLDKGQLWSSPGVAPTPMPAPPNDFSDLSDAGRVVEWSRTSDRPACPSSSRTRRVAVRRASCRIRRATKKAGRAP